MTKTSVQVVVESGAKKVFVSALNWPGWSRSGKGLENAQEQFVSYRSRYHEVVKIAGLELMPEDLDVQVVDEIEGGGVTDFGVPDKISKLEFESLPRQELEQQIALLRACWTYFDQVGASVSAELQKGPRGGGRDRDKVILHVLHAEQGYARHLLVKSAEIELGDQRAIRAHREAVERALTEFGVGENQAPKNWPVRYAIRRMAWHVLDHAWEMEDKTLN